MRKLMFLVPLFLTFNTTQAADNCKSILDHARIVLKRNADDRLNFLSSNERFYHTNQEEAISAVIDYLICKEGR